MNNTNNTNSKVTVDVEVVGIEPIAEVATQINDTLRQLNEMTIRLTELMDQLVIKPREG